MRLLFITPQPPYPPHQGTAIRNWGLLQHLAENHTLALLTFALPGGVSAESPLRQVCSHVVTVPVPVRPTRRRLRDLLAGEPDLAGRLRSDAFVTALRALLARFEPDIAQIEGLELAPYLPAIRAVAPTAKVVYDAHNAEHLIQRRALDTDRRHPRRWLAAVYSALQVPRLARFEAQAARSADAVTCVSAEDSAALGRLAPGLRPILIANGINVADYAGVQPLPLGRTATLVFSGKMDYRPNVDAALWFAGEILPRVRAVHPSVEFHVVGQQPAPAVRRLHGRDGIMISGAVPDTRPRIAAATVYVAPLRMGGGTRFKLLEAFALARPIVSTRLGAEGFGSASGRDLFLADSAHDFAAGILTLLADPALAARLGAAGQAFARVNYDWSVIIPRLTGLYRQLAPPGSARGSS